MTTGSVLVIGSINLDRIIRVHRHPCPGETVVGSELVELPGGKGANQAVAAARLGSNVSMVGRVGADAAGAFLRDTLAAEDVDDSHIGVDPANPTGLANITVADGGDNCIVVVPGANGCLTPEEVESVAADSVAVNVVVTQLETPLPAAEAAATLAARTGARFILNLAPYRRVPEGLVAAADPLVVNEHEAASLLGYEVTTADPSDVAGRLMKLAKSVVVTLGPNGAICADRISVWQCEAPPVVAVDTTGAGDALVGALAHYLAAGMSLQEATTLAVRVASASVIRRGAQPSYPKAGELCGCRKPHPWAVTCRFSDAAEGPDRGTPG